MDRQRRQELWQVITRSTDDELWSCAQSVCEVAVEILGLDSVTMSLYLAKGVQELVGTTDRWGTDIEELQLTLGEGPGVHVSRSGCRLLVPDLTSAWRYWPGFAGMAMDCGVAAVFAWPVAGVREVPMAVLSGYRRQAGGLSGRQLNDATLLAELAATALLDDDTGLTAAMTAAEDGDLGYYVNVSIAAGVVGGEHGLRTGDAFDLLRAYAFGNDRSLLDVADAVLKGRLRIAPPSSG